MKEGFISRLAVFKDDVFDGDVFRRFLGRVDDGVLVGRGVEFRVGVGIRFFYNSKRGEVF